jgi:hypothetical protein
MMRIVPSVMAFLPDGPAGGSTAPNRTEEEQHILPFGSIKGTQLGKASL